MAISGGWITPKNDLELPLRGLFRIFSLIASRWKERNQHYCYLFYQNLLNHGCYRHSRKIMTYKDNLKTDLIILFKNEQMNINEAKKLDHILWPYYPYIRQSDYVRFLFYLLPSMLKGCCWIYLLQCFTTCVSMIWRK